MIQRICTVAGDKRSATIAGKAPFKPRRNGHHSCAVGNTSFHWTIVDSRHPFLRSSCFVAQHYVWDLRLSFLDRASSMMKCETRTKAWASALLSCSLLSSSSYMPYKASCPWHKSCPLNWGCRPPKNHSSYQTAKQGVSYNVKWLENWQMAYL